jgi:hypothetical protein
MRNELNDDDLQKGKAMVDKIIVMDLEEPEILMYTPQQEKEFLRLENDEDLKKIKRYINGTLSRPEAHVGMILGENMKTYFRNEDCWKLSKSGVLFRKWIWKTGVIKFFSVVERAGWKELFLKLHPKASEKPLKGPIDIGVASHPSSNATFQILNKQVYAFHLRRSLAQHKKTCAICTLKNFTTSVQSRDEGMSKGSARI